MNEVNGANIVSSYKDDTMLTNVTCNVTNAIKDKYICRLPDNWNITCEPKKISFDSIRNKFIEAGISVEKADEYYGLKSSIDTDANIIYLTIKTGDVVNKKPLFMGEIKKQGTNDKRIKEGKKKQAIGNAGPDRVAKNYKIAAAYCYLCDKDFFPYNVFLHGCDFGDDMTTTMKAKLTPFFGELNKLNPFFDKDIPWERNGGSCFYQSEDYTYEQLYQICYDCCKIGIDFYKKKYKK